MSSPIQLEGNIKFGASMGSLTDYSAEITALTIHKARNLIEVPGTFYNAQQDQQAGTKNHTLEVAFFTDLASTSFWEYLETVIDAADATAWFSGTFYTGAVSATNPRYYGKIIVSGLDTGGAVGDLRAQTQTFPIKAGYPIRDIIS